MTRSSHVGSSFHRPSPGCLQPHRSYCPSSSPPYLLSPSASLPSATGPALPEFFPKPPAPTLSASPRGQEWSPGSLSAGGGTRPPQGPRADWGAHWPTFWPRKRLLVESTVKPSAGVPSVVLSALAALLTSPCFFLHKQKSQREARAGEDHADLGFLDRRKESLAHNAQEKTGN